MSHIMTHEKTCVCICKNKDADQLRGNCAADQIISAFVFATQIVQFFYFLSATFKYVAIFCGYTATVSDLVGNPNDRFSHDTAHVSFPFSDDETERFKTATRKFMKLFNMPREEKLVNRKSCTCIYTPPLEEGLMEFHQTLQKHSYVQGKYYSGSEFCLHLGWLYDRVYNIKFKTTAVV